MKKLPIIATILLTLNSCGQKTTLDDKYSNLDKFGKTISKLHDSLGKKYNIKDYGFDVECIYGQADLTKLVREMLDLGEFKYKFVSDGQDKSKQQYYSIYQIIDKSYEFRTSSVGDYVDLETVFPSLQQIVKDNKPEYEYNYSNMDGGQIAFLIFAKTTELVQAVDEGYPCSLESGRWQWDKEWKWGVYSDIILEKIPDFADLKRKYYQTLKELYDEGFNVPNLTINRIYIDDIFKDKSVDIVIDGGPGTTSANDIIGHKVRCFWEGWGVLLAYTLVTRYNGKPTLYDKELNTTTTLRQQEYVTKAKTAFGR
ncbi:hypothetical protein [Foetidibacter luteolus]|uniref:hypothetical protein n=1 Tax=Foetidibacter luteolus TaxID=2608880 RepID=UPI00129A42C1|nr:hypothetical protein [Foetidibacter luteolus]